MFIGFCNNTKMKYISQTLIVSARRLWDRLQTAPAWTLNRIVANNSGIVV